MWADWALRRRRVSSRMGPIFLRLTSSRCSLRISINRLMWVPLWRWGRLTYMLMQATVCWVPLNLSNTTMGYEIFLTPTLSMSMVWGLTWFWTSAISATGSMTVGVLWVDMAHGPDLGRWVVVIILPGRAGAGIRGAKSACPVRRR